MNEKRLFYRWMTSSQQDPTSRACHLEASRGTATTPHTGWCHSLRKKELETGIKGGEGEKAGGARKGKQAGNTSGREREKVMSCFLSTLSVEAMPLFKLQEKVCRATRWIWANDVSVEYSRHKCPPILRGVTKLWLTNDNLHTVLEFSLDKYRHYIFQKPISVLVIPNYSTLSSALPTISCHSRVLHCILYYIIQHNHCPFLAVISPDSDHDRQFFLLTISQ